MDKTKYLFFVFLGMATIGGIFACGGNRVDSLQANTIAVAKCTLERTLEPAAAQAAIESISNAKETDEDKAARKKLESTCTDNDLKIADSALACSLTACLATSKHIGDLETFQAELVQKANEKCSHLKGKESEISAACRALVGLH